MVNPNPKVDAYIEQAPEFAQPILTKLRALFHRAHPEIEETIKWGKPSFEYKGMLGGMGAFKEHVSYGFWKAKAMNDPHGIFAGAAKASPFAIKATSVKDLPPQRVLLAYMKEAVALNEAGAKSAPNRRTLKVPADLAAEFAKKKHRKAKTTFEAFSRANRNEYVEWLTEAKREATRAKRLAQALEWMAEGKPRNWKYMKWS